MEHIGKEMEQRLDEEELAGVEGESSGLILNHEVSTDKSWKDTVITQGCLTDRVANKLFIFFPTLNGRSTAGWDSLPDTKEGGPLYECGYFSLYPSDLVSELGDLPGTPESLGMTALFTQTIHCFKGQLCSTQCEVFMDALEVCPASRYSST